MFLTKTPTGSDITSYRQHFLLIKWDKEYVIAYFVPIEW